MNIHFTKNGQYSGKRFTSSQGIARLDTKHGAILFRGSLGGCVVEKTSGICRPWIGVHFPIEGARPGARGWLSEREGSYERY